jgi:simple sugar transport system permease protein
VADALPVAAPQSLTPGGVKQVGVPWRQRLADQLPAGVAVGRFVGALVVALIGFAVVLLLQGRSPIDAYANMFSVTLGTAFGRSEVVVKAIPLMLCALAVAVPARVGLVNVGGEGQLYIGAWLATGVALGFSGLPIWLLLPLMLIASIVGGGLWALFPAVLRAKGWLNETISTLLLNYVATLLVQFFVFGPWKDPKSANFPQSPQFVDAARLPTFGAERIHAGLIFALVAVVVLFFILRQTRWGFEMRAIGGNPEAARRAGIRISTYIIGALVVGGALAGIAGLGEVSAIQGRLVPSISPGYGFIGFLVSWLAGHNPLLVVVMALLLGVLTASGDSLQISQHLPFASVNLLMALTLVMVLVQRGRPAEATR